MATPGPPDYYQGNFKTFVPRCPELEDKRLRHFVDVVSMMLNSLVRNGGIVRSGQTDFNVLSPDTSNVTGENKDSVTLAVGMAVAVHTSGSGFVRADASTTAKEPVGLVAIAAAATLLVSVTTDGFVTLADWSAITEEGSATLAAHSRYYLSTSNVGKITTTAPTTIGKVVTKLGQAISPTTLNVEIAQSILL